MAGEWSFPEREREVAAAGETGVALADMIGEDTAEGPPPPAESSGDFGSSFLFFLLCVHFHMFQFFSQFKVQRQSATAGQRGLALMSLSAASDLIGYVISLLWRYPI